VLHLHVTLDDLEFLLGSDIAVPSANAQLLLDLTLVLNRFARVLIPSGVFACSL
jgi:hypothetical protein